MSYYNEKVLSKFHSAFESAKSDVLSGAVSNVIISNGNRKMGAVASVSTLPFLTCPACCKSTCGEKCYAAKIANLYPTVLRSYAVNTAMAIYKPTVYWRQIDSAVKGVRFFRFHVSGDVINTDYFNSMVKIAIDNPHCEILAFTKRFGVVNAWIDANGDLPANLHIMFSGWANLVPDNPHNLPETNVYTCEDDFNDSWLTCGGNCFECGCRGVGCWQAKKGDVIAFKVH